MPIISQVIQLQQFTKKGREIYTKLQKDLESQHFGKIVAIDVETGDYFLGDTVIEAGKELRVKTPINEMLWRILKAKGGPETT